MPAVLLVRHAQASFGAENYDRLSGLGEEQARLLPGAFESRNWRPVRVIAGTLRRQRETAAICLDGTSREVETDPRLDEYPTDEILGAHGVADVSLEQPGVTSVDFQAILDRALRSWVQSGAGTPAALSWPDFQAGCLAALHAVAEGLGSGESAAVFTSGGVIAAVAASLIGATGTEFASLNRVLLNAGLTKVVFGRSGASLVSFNEHAHLDAAGPSLLTYR